MLRNGEKILNKRIVPKQSTVFHFHTHTSSLYSPKTYYGISTLRPTAKWLAPITGWWWRLHEIPELLHKLLAFLRTGPLPSASWSAENLAALAPYVIFKKLVRISNHFLAGQAHWIVPQLPESSLRFIVVIKFCFWFVTQHYGLNLVVIGCDGHCDGYLTKLISHFVKSFTMKQVTIVVQRAR